jgi:hypothetical protein
VVNRLYDIISIEVGDTSKFAGGKNCTCEKLVLQEIIMYSSRAYGKGKVVAVLKHYTIKLYSGVDI